MLVRTTRSRWPNCTQLPDFAGEPITDRWLTVIRLNRAPHHSPGCARSGPRDTHQRRVLRDISKRLGHAQLCKIRRGRRDVVTTKPATCRAKKAFDLHRNVRPEARRAAFRPSPLNSARAPLCASLSAGRSASPVCLGRGSDLLRPREGSEFRALRAPQPSAPGEGGVRFRLHCQEGLGARRRPGLCVLPSGLHATLCQSDHFGCCDPVCRPGTGHALSSGFRSPRPDRTPQMGPCRLIRRGTVTSIEVAP